MAEAARYASLTPIMRVLNLSLSPPPPHRPSSAAHPQLRDRSCDIVILAIRSHSAISASPFRASGMRIPMKFHDFAPRDSSQRINSIQSNDSIQLGGPYRRDLIRCADLRGLMREMRIDFRQKRKTD
jgi:hypothetical protein